MNIKWDFAVMFFEAIYKIAGFYFVFWISVEPYKVATLALYSNITVYIKIPMIFASLFIAICCVYYLYKAYKAISALIEAYWAKRIFPEIIKLGDFVQEIKNSHLSLLRTEYFKSESQENEEWLFLNNSLDELFGEFHELIDGITVNKANFETYCELGFIIYHDFLRWNQIFLKKPVFELSLEEILDNAKESDYCIFGIMKKIQNITKETLLT